MLKASPRSLQLFKSGLRYSSAVHRSTALKTQQTYKTLPHLFGERETVFTRLFTKSLRKMGDASATEGTQPGATLTDKKVFFFDIDNCLYPKSAKVHDRMAQLIDEYFANHLSLPWEEAVRLHKEYYQNYGLALEGLVRHHQIDPLEYNAKVDDALPLEGVIVPNPKLKLLLQDIDRSKVRVWLFTNAYVTHGKRVVRLLEVEDQFEGITFCDYAKVPFVCKPHKNMFEKAMREAGVDRVEDCFFVDDSYINCKAAKELGWTAAHLVEEGVAQPKAPASQFQIESLEQLRNIYPQLFKSMSQA